MMQDHVETRQAHDRVRYTSMTPDQRQARRDRQNTRNAARCNAPSLVSSVAVESTIDDDSHMHNPSNPTMQINGPNDQRNVRRRIMTQEQIEAR